MLLVHESLNSRFILSFAVCRIVLSPYLVPDEGLGLGPPVLPSVRTDVSTGGAVSISI